MPDEVRLDNLPLEVLVFIFNRCRPFDLVRLSEVCRRFNAIIADDILWIARRNQPLVTNQVTKEFRDRCNSLLCPRRRWQVSENWQSGRWKQTILVAWELKAMPWISLTKDTLWWSNGNQLCAFRRRRRRNSRSFEAFSDSDKIFERDDISSDISKFVVRDDYVISGHSDGGVTFWSRSSSHNAVSDLRINGAHIRNVNAVDEISGSIISGSTDGTVKIWSRPCDNVISTPLSTIRVINKIWSLAAEPINGKFAVGSSGYDGIPPLKILDVERCSESTCIRHPWRNGAGILHMVWENSNILLTCGYDTCVRKWDTRTGSCVASWMDPTDATLYCISTDYHNTILTGTQYNCKAVLWDQRMTRYVQLYFLSNVGSRTSPLYSVSFDSSNLYGTTDRRLVELNFSGYNYCQHDFRNVFRYGYQLVPAANALR